MSSERATSSTSLSIAVWSTQGLLSLTFTGTAFWKVLTPIAQLATMIPWAGEVSPVFLYATAFFDLCGGLGILLPTLTRIQPRLTVFAALGCAALQVCATVFHLSRGEVRNTPFNVFLFALSLFVAWGRMERKNAGGTHSSSF